MSGPVSLIGEFTGPAPNHENSSVEKEVHNAPPIATRSNWKQRPHRKKARRRKRVKKRK